MIPILLILLSPMALRATPMPPADSLVIHFGYNQATLSAREATALDGYLASHKDDKLTISGYSDSRGSAFYNEKLSLQRAMTVKGYLIEKGLDAAKITSVAGFGAAGPVDGDPSEEAWAKNRRVVLLFESPPATPTPPAESEAEAPKPPPYVKGPSIRQQLADTSIHVGSKLTLKNVNFFGGYHIPLPGTTIILDTLAQAMLDNPNLRLHIDGYICCLPDSSEGKDAQTGHFDLSIQRAKFVYDYLVKHQVAKERLSYEGHGSTSKLYPEEKDEREQALNRRVEITVTAK